MAQFPLPNVITFLSGQFRKFVVHSEHPLLNPPIRWSQIKNFTFTNTKAQGMIL